MPRTVQHAHKLRRHKYKSTGTAVFFCTLPDCNFKTETHLVLGKKAICWRCGREFTMNEYSIRLAKPHCNSCTKSKDVKVPEVTREITKEVAREGIDELKERMSRLVTPGVMPTDDGGEM